MKYTMILMAALLLSGVFWAAAAPEQHQSNEAVTFDKPPQPVGGMEALAKVEYPASAKEDNIQGIVYISLTIGTGGNVLKAAVQKGVRKDLDDAALKALKKTKWIPAEKNGKPVEATVVVPVKFKLEDKK